MKGSPAKLGTISGTAGHSSALKQVEKKGFFEKLTGRKFKETTLGKDLQKKKEDIQSLVKNPKKHVVTKNVEKQLKTKGDANVLGTNKTLQVHKSSSGSGAIKPSGKNKEYTAIGGKGYTFTRGGGDPYQYRTTDEGKTFQAKKVGETDWTDTKGGFDKISASYTASTNKMKGSPAKQKRVPKKEETLERKMDKATKFKGTKTLTPKSTNIDELMDKATKFKGTKTLTKKFHPRDYQKKTLKN